jgi:hypothetical protein
MVKTNDTTNHKAKIFLGVIFLKFSLALGFVNLNSTEEMQIRNKSYKKTNNNDNFSRPIAIRKPMLKTKIIMVIMVTFLSNIIHNNIGKYLQTMILLK